MRRIQDLFQEQDRVWVYLGEEPRDFMLQAAAEGFRWLNGDPVTPRDRGIVVGIRREGTVGQVSLYHWCLSFQCSPGSVPLRVDWSRYRAGEKDFLCTVPHMAGCMTR